ncbi:helix-turn-helix domain-containing protein [Aminipila sp.]|uniref:helix-turn-helix domain-containing protein n=1 Tax=Aminipila sp. TaxID=2060095 RepID=UPI002897E8E1|nr:helix-turn-helix transcriptional regulator [Aminipila sp.]
MKSLGDKIKELRIALGMTQEYLADQLEITVKSVQRYERGKSRPDTYTIAKLAVFFEVSSDYLLGISCIQEQKEEIKNKVSGEGTYNIFYENYLKSKNDYIIDVNATYYWIEANEDKIGGQTQWVGWTDETREMQIRILRPVIPDKAIELCKQVRGKPMIINSEEDVGIFLIFGGQAIVKKEICEKYLPWFLEPFIVKN